MTRKPTPPRTRKPASPPSTPSRSRPARKPAKAAPRASKATAKADLAPPAPLGYERDFHACLPLALALDAAEVRPYRGDANRALQNVTVGLAAITPLVEHLRHQLPGFELQRVTVLPSVARALIWAADRVQRPRPRTTASVDTLRRAQVIRRKLLAAAVVLVGAGLLPADEVERIRAGSGARDTATDCRQLAQLFADHAAALAGKTAVTAADVREAAEAGAQLNDELSASEGRRARDLPVALAARIDQRDRLWTLLALGHRELRRAGMVVWVDEVDAHVPPLLGFDAPSRRPRPTPPPPAPVPEEPAKG